MREPLFCTFCGSPAIHATSTIFFTFGPYDDNRATYAEEGDVDVYRCTRDGCGEPFANLYGYALTPSEDAPEDLHLLPPQP